MDDVGPAAPDEPAHGRKRGEPTTGLGPQHVDGNAVSKKDVGQGPCLPRAADRHVEAVPVDRRRQFEDDSLGASDVQ
jgi:hypothetical protein